MSWSPRSSEPQAIKADDELVGYRARTAVGCHCFQRCWAMARYWLTCLAPFSRCLATAAARVRWPGCGRRAAWS